MKHASEHSKTPRQGQVGQMHRPVAGANGISLAPPTYGIDFVDRQSIQLKGGHTIPKGKRPWLPVGRGRSFNARAQEAVKEREARLNEDPARHRTTRTLYIRAGAVRERLRERYPEIAPEVLQDLAVAKSILMSTKRGDAAMKKLDEALEGQKTVNALDAVLKEREWASGLKEREEVTELLKPQEFQELLASGKPMIDLGAGAEHGAFTHRLQAYILTEHGESAPPLRRTIRGLFKAIAAKEAEDRSNPNRTVWDDIFDFDDSARKIIGLEGSKPEGAKKEARYSSPEATNTRLSGPKGRSIAPTLSAILEKAREDQVRFNPRSLFALREAIAFAIALRMHSRGAIDANEIPALQNELAVHYGEAELRAKWEKIA